MPRCQATPLLGGDSPARGGGSKTQRRCRKDARKTRGSAWVRHGSSPQTSRNRTRGAVAMRPLLSHPRVLRASFLHLRKTLLALPRPARCRDSALQRRSQDPMHQFAAHPESPVPGNETLVRPRCLPPCRCQSMGIAVQRGTWPGDVFCGRPRPHAPVRAAWRGSAATTDVQRCRLAVAAAGKRPIRTAQQGPHAPVRPAAFASGGSATPHAQRECPAGRGIRCRWVSCARPLILCGAVSRSRKRDADETPDPDQKPRGGQNLRQAAPDGESPGHATSHCMGCRLAGQETRRS